MISSQVEKMNASSIGVEMTPATELLYAIPLKGFRKPITLAQCQVRGAL
jgi:hypothetical protein